MPKVHQEGWYDNDKLNGHTAPMVEGANIAFRLIFLNSIAKCCFILSETATCNGKQILKSQNSAFTEEIKRREHCYIKALLLDLPQWIK